MSGELLVPDLPVAAPSSAPVAAVPLDAPQTGDDGGGFATALARAVEGLGGGLRRADTAERALAAGHGSIAHAAIARAEADAEVAVAAALVDHVARALNVIAQMQV
ncbi:hypothetical protein EPN52_00035 [bacterium]|nr:MAG: hypothetical protein EPN52_00035 [bacterium]